MAELKITLVNGQEAGATMQLVNKELREARKALDKAVVGTDAYAKAQANIKHAEKNYERVTQQIQGTQKASELLKAAWNNLPGAQFFNQIGESFGMLKGGVGGLVSQFGILKTAIAATGIGLLVIAFATLYGWFKKTDEGATLLSGIFRGFGIVVDKVFGGLIDVFKNVGQYFTGEKSIKQGLLDLVEFIQTNLINRVKAFGVIFRAITDGDLKGMADGFIQLTTGVTDATNKMAAFAKEVGNAMQEGIDLEKQLDAIEDRARELSVINANTEKEVSRLLLQSKNVGLSYEERIALLDQASALETKAHQEQVANAKALEALRLKEIQDAKARNITSDELDQAYADAQIARINLEKESINLQEKIANRRTALQEKELAEKAKAREEELKAEQNITDLKIALIEDQQQREIEQIWAQTEKKIEALVGTSEQVALQEALLKEQEILAVQAVVDKYANEAAAKRKAELDKKAEEERQAKEKSVDTARREAEEKQQIEQAYRDFASGSLGELINLLGEDEKARKKNATAIKAFTTAKILVDLQSEIAGYMANPASTASLGVVGTLKAALAFVRAGLAIRSVQSQKFARGGILRGPSHRDGGIDMMVGGRVAANAEGGEPILTAGVSRNPRLLAAASHINVLAGGRPLMEMGGVVPSNPYAELQRSSPSLTTTTATNDAERQMAFFRQELAAEREAMLAKITSLRVVNDPTDTQREIDVINEIQNRVNV